MSARVRRVGLLGHTGRPGVRRAAARLIAVLGRRGATVRLEATLAREMGRAGLPLGGLARWCQVMIALGGDGTALNGARAMAGRRGVLMPVNLGGLGFLTVAEEGELTDATRQAFAGRWPVVRRRLVGAVVRRRGRPIHRARAMNDAVVKTAGGYAALHLRMSVLGHDLGHLVADGVICASASGSTAYSLSAGGPVLAPDVEAFVVTPVCAHTLGSRPLVLSPSGRVTLRVLGSFDRAMLLLDGQESLDLAAGDEIEVGLTRAAVRIFQNPARPFGRSLQAKLGWQGSERRSL
jgi:NAD+ kinase